MIEATQQACMQEAIEKSCGVKSTSLEDKSKDQFQEKTYKLIRKKTNKNEGRNTYGLRNDIRTQ